MNLDQRTELSSRLGTRYPIFGFSHSLDVTVALAEAGCFAIYGATRDMPEEIAAKINQLRDRIGDRPFGVDLLLPSSVGHETDRSAVVETLPAEHRQFVQHLREKYEVPAATKPTFFSSHVRSQQLLAEQFAAVMESSVNAFAAGIGMPASIVERARAAGKLTMALVGSPRHARKAKEAGVDLMIAQGADAGGHTGSLGTYSLVPQVVEIAGDTPVIAAGGVGHGRHIAAAFAMGAQGVWMGTAWLTSREHKLSSTLLRKVLAAQGEDTVISRSHSGKPARLLRTGWTDEWEAPGAPRPLPMPLQQVLTADLVAAINEHHIEALTYEAAGQGVGWFNELQTVGEIVRRLVTETGTAFQSMSKVLVA